MKDFAEYKSSQALQMWRVSHQFSAQAVRSIKTFLNNNNLHALQSRYLSRIFHGRVERSEQQEKTAVYFVCFNSSMNGAFLSLKIRHRRGQDFKNTMLKILF